jgi:CRISPR-associated protein Csc2
MWKGYEKHLQDRIPLRPGARYAHLLVLRETQGYAVFKTDGELNTARVRAGRRDDATMTRLVLFKRKQTTPERLTGRELLRRYGAAAEGCVYNEGFCGACPDCVLYGYAIGDTGSEKSKVYVDSAFSLRPYDESHETFTLNAPYEDGTMTRGDKTTSRFSEQDHVLPEVFFPSVVTVRDPTARGLSYVVNNIRRTRRYGAQTTRAGQVRNEILGVIFADGEIFSNLRLTQALHDWLRDKGGGQPRSAVQEGCAAVCGELLREDGVVSHALLGAELAAQLQALDAVFTNEAALQGFLQELHKETQAYALEAGGKAKDDKAKDDKAKEGDGGKGKGRKAGGKGGEAAKA